MKSKTVCKKVFIYCILVLTAVTTLFPFVWMVFTSLKTPAEIISTEFILFPAQPQWWHYKELLFGHWDETLGMHVVTFDFLTGLKNTLIIEIATIPVMVFTSGLVAFAFAKMRLRHASFWLLFLMSGMMIPYASVLLPQYRMYKAINWIDTLMPFIVPSLFGNVGMIFFFIQYMKSIPSPLFEAAKLDGAGYLCQYVMIMVPLLAPAISCQVVFSFIGNWNDFFAPSIYLADQSVQTIQVKLQSLANSQHAGNTAYLYAGSFISCLPLFVIYIAFQRFFVGSLAIGGVKF